MIGARVGFFSPQGFDPKSISNLSVWFDASDASTITLNGSAVSQWNDKSGNGLHASQSTANNQPAYVTNDRNGLATVSFDGTNDSLVTSSFANGWTTFTSFVVMRILGNANIGLQIVWTRSTDRQRAIVADTSNTAALPAYTMRGHLNSPAVNDFLCTNAYSTANWKYITNRYDGTTSSRSAAFTGRLNGAAVTNTATGAITTSSVANTVFRIGNRSDGTRGMNAKVGEMLVYAASLSSADVSSVESYLAKKWGF